MGDRPDKDKWYDEDYGKAWDEGYLAAGDGQPLESNPYKESGHERDSTHSDECHYWWYSGWNEFHYERY
jgi:hypothetical protein